jgi:dephospho-CoA kinase
MFRLGGTGLPANDTIIIGLTGGIGSGKTEAGRILESLGAVHIDADAISRALTSPEGEALPEIREAFGDSVFNVDGSLDRHALAAAVFENPDRRRALEAILHPRVQRRALEMIDRARRNGAAAVVLDVPLLFETGMDAVCDVTWVVEANPQERVRRIMARGGLTEEEIASRVKNQMSDEDRAARAGKVVKNDGSVEKLAGELTNLYHQLIKASK